MSNARKSRTILAALALTGLAAGHAGATETKPANPKPATIDTNSDGKPDAWDRNTDGRADAWDKNGDGKPDAWDDDFNGQPDEAPVPRATATTNPTPENR